MRSWLHAWIPQSDEERAVIFEDDTTLSPGWYRWLKQAWSVYANVPDLAGISLQRQTLIPLQPWRDSLHITTEADRSVPFLYSLLGSIGFSPNPVYWLQFLRWTKMIDLDTYDVSIPGLVTSDWWSQHDKRQMWTQHFIYFSLKLDLYTLFHHLPENETLAAHMRAKGVHTHRDLGADFPIARNSLRLQFPHVPGDELRKYGWDGKRIVLKNDVGHHLVKETLFHTAKRINSQAGFVYMLFFNPGFLEMTKNWICNVLRVAHHLLDMTLFISTDIEATGMITFFQPDLQIFTLSSGLLESVSYGQLRYYELVLERLYLQGELLEHGVNVYIIESDQFLAADVTNVLREAFQSHEIIAGQESGFAISDSPVICGGFHGIAASPRAVSFFSSFVTEYAKELRERRSEDGMNTLENYENDQIALTRHALEQDLKVHYVDRCVYASGIWFTDQTYAYSCPTPMVLHNNYIVGNSAKIIRAKHVGHWYLSQDSMQCK